VVEWRWGLKGGSKKEKSRDDEKRSKDGPREYQEEKTPSSTPC